MNVNISHRFDVDSLQHSLRYIRDAPVLRDAEVRKMDKNDDETSQAEVTSPASRGPHQHVVFIKVHKAASSTLHNIMHRYAQRHNLSVFLRFNRSYFTSSPLVLINVMNTHISAKIQIQVNPMHIFSLPNNS